ncbi:MAG: hypothetical protein E7623_05655 [Ruminococcaceae bacterium]|nr:hypothetical protein [Oscillospiraceae bacterium]
MRKILALLLCAVFVLSAFSFAACGGEDTEKGTEAGSASGSSTELLTDEEGNLLDGIPDGKYDFKERDFIITVPWPEHYGVNNYDMQELTSDVVYDEIYYRNREIENRFNCKISALELGGSGESVEVLSPHILSDAGTFNLIAFAYSTNAHGLISANLLTPWNDVPIVDYSKPWWNKSALECGTLNEKIFFNAGSLNWYSIAMTTVFYFNETVRSEHNIPNLYELVDNGEWTIDKVIEFSRVVAKDDGNGIWNGKDTYGLVADHLDIMVTGFGFEAVKNNGDGTYTMNLANEDHHKYANKVIELMKRNNHLAFNNTDNNLFKEDRTLLHGDWIYNVTEFRMMESDFGILPLPKFDTNQESYHSFSQGWGLANAIPVNTKPEDYEFIGVIVEALSCYSYNKVLPAYYDYTLKGRDTRDTDSWRMLDLINSTLIYDFGYFFICGNSIFNSCMPLQFTVRYGREENTLSSFLETHIDELTTHYDEIMEFGKG